MTEHENGETQMYTHTHKHTHLFNLLSVMWKHILLENVHLQRNPNSNKTYRLLISIVYSGLHTQYHIILTNLYSGICLLDSKAYVLYSFPRTSFYENGISEQEFRSCISNNQNYLRKSLNCKMNTSTYALLLLCFKIFTVKNMCS